MLVKVQKKDGRLEDFDRNKIINGVVKSGTTAEQAEEVARQVETWLPTAVVDGVINSIAIRTKVLEILRELNPQAAAAFGTYKKPSESQEDQQPPAAPAAS